MIKTSSVVSSQVTRLRNLRQLRRHSVLPALLGAIAMVFWPALASANCCCRQAESLSQVAEIAGGVCETTCPGCCAEKTTPRKSDVVKQSVPSCCETGQGGASGLDFSGCGESESCKCEFGCCQFTHATLSAPVESDSSTSFVAALSELVSILPSPSRSESSESIDRPCFLNAQDRCALLCRWLK
jgi:hypothetical protein